MTEPLVTEEKVRAAEFRDENRLRVRGDIERCLKKSGCIVPAGVVDALTCQALEEALDTRYRMAHMVECFIEAYDGELSSTKLESLAVVMYLHHRVQDNVAFMPDLPG